MLNLTRTETDVNIDFLLGTILLLTSLLGALFNTAALCYFRSLVRKNKNGEFFRRLYMVINFTDILICFSAFPSIEALFSESRKGYLLTNPGFCSVWMVYWWILCQKSVLLVATLSVSRLTILRHKTIELRPSVAFLVPAIFVVSKVCMFIVAFSMQFMFTTYVPEYLVCSFIAFKDNLTEPVTTKMLTTIIGTLSAFNFITSMCFFLTCASFIASLYLLHRSAKASTVINSSTKRHVEAAKTVILVTLLYLTFNTPIMVVMSTLVSKLLLNPPNADDLKTGDMIRYFFSEPFGQSSRFANQYVIAITNMLFVCLNSALNPIALYFRIDGFRNCVWSKIYLIVRRNENRVDPSLARMDSKTRLTRPHFIHMRTLSTVDGQSKIVKDDD